MTNEDRPTLIYYVQTVLNTFKRSVHTKDREYVIEMLSEAMKYQNDIWNDAIERAAHKAEANGAISVAMEIRKLKK